MKKIVLFFVACMTVMLTCTSCVTTQAMDYSYQPYDVENNVVVVDNVCYVYYTNPTTLFLNSLHIIDGAYYYSYNSRYIPVVFPNWYAWSPHRYFYYDRNRWFWRDRYHYNHADYRRNHHWNDYRRPPHKGDVNKRPPHNGGFDRRPPQRPHNNGNFNNGRRPNVDRPHNGGNRTFGNGTRFERGSSTRVTAPNGGNRSFGQPSNRGFGGGNHRGSGTPQRNFGGRR